VFTRSCKKEVWSTTPAFRPELGSAVRSSVDQPQSRVSDYVVAKYKTDVGMLPQSQPLEAAGVDKRRVSTKQLVASSKYRTEAALQHWRGERTERFRHKVRKHILEKQVSVLVIDKRKDWFLCWSSGGSRNR